MRTAANLTSTLLAHHVAVKLETILDREAKISHEAFAAQIEARLGYGEGDTAKGPDMKVWNKGRGLTDVSRIYFCRALACCLTHVGIPRSIGHQLNFVIPL